MLIALLVTWLLPIQPELAGQRLDPYRLILLVTVIPFALALVSGKAGRFTISDGLMIAFCGWIVLTMVYHHGMPKFALGVIQAVEFFGGYAAGRLLVRSLDDLKRYVRYFLVALLVLAPFAYFELFTGRQPLTEILGRFIAVNEKYQEWRSGMSRVQAGLPHSILFGMFCAMNAALVMYVYRGKLMRVAPRMGLVFAMTFAALSSAPILALAVQAGTYVWGAMTRNNWWALVALVAFVLTFLELASNSGPLFLMIKYLTFDSATGWYRYYIWVNVIENVKGSPILGIGFNDWARPVWMVTASVDSFWLVLALRHGLVGLLLLLASIALHGGRVLRARGLSDEARQLRDGYMISLIALCFMLTTVYVWGSVAAAAFFFLGAGSFFYTSPNLDPAAQAEPTAGGDPAPAPRGAPVYARSFPKDDKTQLNTRFQK